MKNITLKPGMKLLLAGLVVLVAAGIAQFYPMIALFLAFGGLGTVVAGEKSEELKAIEAATEKIKEMKKEIGDKLDKTELDKVTKELKELKANYDKWEESKVAETVKSINETIAKFKTQIEEMGEDIANSKDAAKSGGRQVKSFGEAIIEAIKANKLHEKKEWSKNEHQTFEVNYSVAQKSPATMSTGNVTPSDSGAIPFSLADVEYGLTRIVRRRPWLMQIANVSPTNNKYVQWAEQANPDGAAAATTEGSTKNLIDFDWVEKSKEVTKYTAYIKVSKEALSDLASLQNEIDTELRETVLLATDAALLVALLAGDTAYDAGNFAASVANPTFSDVLRTAIAQVVAAQFIPNFILLHPNDVAKMDLEKGTDGHYVLPPFKSADGMVISGVRIIENTGQTEDKFTVGDFSKFNVRVREGLNVDMGLDGNDFTKNLITILAEIRLAVYIKTNHAAAFVSGDFGDAQAALDSGS